MKILKTVNEPQTIVIVDGYIEEGREQDIKVTDDECIFTVKSNVSEARLESFGFVYIMTKEEFLEYSKSDDCESESGNVEGFRQYIVISDFVGNIGIDSDNEFFDLDNLDMSEYLYWQDRDYSVYLKVEGFFNLEAVELDKALELVEGNETSIFTEISTLPLSFVNDANGWKWVIKGYDGEIIGSSNKYFEDKDQCLYNADLVSRSLSTMKI